MKSVNYTKVCAGLIKSLSDKQREIISRRFGLGRKKRETLEFIGKEHGVTRERVRQIERDAIKQLEPNLKTVEPVLQSIKSYVKSNGGIKREDIALEELGGKEKNEAYCLMALSGLKRFSDTEDLHALWAFSDKEVDSARKIINGIYSKLKNAKRPMTLKEFKSSVPSAALASYLEASKKIYCNPEGFFGLRDWPEINPRGIKDKAYIVFKKEQKPLHFVEVSNLIGSALPQTVHNELIKDGKFVLVGRGMYALKEWGYEEGHVRDVIHNVLKSAKKPLSKEEIMEKVLRQRVVQANTVSLNLSNKEHFTRNSSGKYWINQA